MTYDFAPEWLDTVSVAADRTAATSGAAMGPAPLVPPPCAPAPPSMPQVAALVEELFAEGSLSYDQLRSLSLVPELDCLLGDTMANVPAQRRIPRTGK